MRTGLIIPQPLYYFSKEFLTNLIEKNKQYHLCFVKGAYDFGDLFDFLEIKAKNKDLNVSLLNNMHNNLSDFRAATRYLEARDDIDTIILIDKSNLSLIYDIAS